MLEEKSYKDLFVNNPSALFILDGEGRFSEVNKRFTEVTGYSMESLRGKRIEDLLAKDKRWEVMEYHKAKVKHKNKPFQCEVPLRTADGREITVILRANLVADKRFAVGSLEDVTEKKRMEKKIRELYEYMQAVLNIQPVALTCLDREGRVKFCNRAAEELYGYPAQELLGKRCDSFFPEPKVGEELMRNTLEKGGVKNVEVQIKTKDGEKKTVLLSSHVLLDEFGDVREIICSKVDVTEKKKLELELERRAVELEEKNKEVENFLYAVSHDLKSPIISIEGFISALDKEYGDKLDEEARFYLERIKKNTELMDTLISDLLELSRVGRITQPLEEVDLNVVLKDLAEEFSYKYKARVEVGSMPRVVGEKNRIIQVFTNLLDNACKYMGDEEPLIQVGCRDAGGEWVFYVRDNGLGIAREYLDKVFMPFYRIPREKARGVEGTGLGLAIVKKIVEYHGGRVWVESKLEEGSTFYFTLPK